jgi:hypothetical protein
MATLIILFFFYSQKKRNCMHFTDKGNAMVPEWPASAAITHVVDHSCLKFEKHCLT